MTPKEDINVENVMMDMFALFKKHHMDSVDVISVTTLIAGGLASVSNLNKKFYMGICEHAYDSSDYMDVGTLQ